VLDVDVGVLHRPFTAAIVDAEECCKAKGVPRRPVLVVERALIGRYQTPARRDEIRELLTLLIREAGDVGQYDGLEPRDVLGIEQLVVHHVKRNARLDKGLIPAVDRVIHLLASVLAAVPGGRILRIDQADSREVADVAQVPFVSPVPVVDVRDRLHPAAVVEHAAELGIPGTHAVGDAIRDPEANLRFALSRVLPAVTFFHTHREDAPNGLAAEGGPVLLRALAVRPGSHQPPACLPVREEDI